MQIEAIVEAVRANRINVTQHARLEARNDILTLDEILFSTQQGAIIEDYPADRPFPSCLILGRTPTEEPVHSVWAYDVETGIAVLITVYRPDPDQWIDWKERKKS